VPNDGLLVSGGLITDGRGLMCLREHPEIHRPSRGAGVDLVQDVAPLRGPGPPHAFWIDLRPGAEDIATDTGWRPAGRDDAR
jgi:hypothetical protein